MLLTHNLTHPSRLTYNLPGVTNYMCLGLTYNRQNIRQLYVHGKVDNPHKQYIA